MMYRLSPAIAATLLSSRSSDNPVTLSTLNATEMRKHLTLSILATLVLGLMACSNSTSPTDSGISLTTFSLSPGDILRFEDTTTSSLGVDISSFDDTVVSVSGASGAQILVIGVDTLRMGGNAFFGPYNGSQQKLASFSSAKGATLTTWTDQLVDQDGNVEQTLTSTLTCKNPDTTITLPAGSFRVSASSYRAVSDKVGQDAVSMTGMLYFSPVYGQIGASLTVYSGQTPEAGTVVVTSNTVLTSIIKK